MTSIASHLIDSALAESQLGLDIPDVLAWITTQNEAVDVRVRHSSFRALDKWSYDERQQSIRHESGRFFSIIGIHVHTNWGYKAEWEQPIILQPEVGYLGFLVKEFGGILHFLVQAKIEPGNVNKVQLSPTLQATRSNYSRVHAGRSPAYLRHFQDAKPHQILLDQLQSEQGARFLRKRNRNIVVRVDEEIDLEPNFAWLTLGQIKTLMAYDHLVNMDTRTVIAGLPYGTLDVHSDDGSGGGPGDARTAPRNGVEPVRRIANDILTSTRTSEGSLHSLEEIISRITHVKSLYDLDVTRANLKDLDEWVFTDGEIHHEDRLFFRVIPVQVEIGNREVQSWSQPMVQPAQEGLCALVCRRINGLLHVAMQLKMECGNHDVIELAPTVQTLTGDYRHSRPGVIPFLELVLRAPKDQVVLDTLQSEEGGRFFHEQNRYMIVLLPDEAEDGWSGATSNAVGRSRGIRTRNDARAAWASSPFMDAAYGELPDRYVWMTLHQVAAFLKFNNYVNVQARSLIAAMSFQ